jgi:serine/threonine-protein kinase RsbW
VPERARTERLSIRSDPVLIRDARRWLTRIVDGAGWSGEESHDLAVALSEACSNAYRYAYEGRTDGRIDLFVELWADEIELAVRDYGKGFDQETYRTPDLSQPREGGYGIYLMQQLTDRLEHRPMESGTLVVMGKTRRAAGENRPGDQTQASAEEVHHVR